jgi:rod shape determining protein RodA
MSPYEGRYLKIDWITVLLYACLVGIGWINIYSASVTDTSGAFLDFSTEYTKQLVWIGLSLVLILVILALDMKFYERFSSVIYLVSLLSLAGLFLFGNTVNGATSWYNFGGVSIQPSEFAKAATALALAKYVADLQTSMSNLKDQLRAFLIILLPAILILPQPDPGSSLVYAALIFPLYREGLSGVYIWVGFLGAGLFILTLALGFPWMVGIIAALLMGVLIARRKQRRGRMRYVLIALGCVAFCYSVNYIFNNVFEQRHRDRFNIVLGKESDIKGIGYNTNQSEIAIGSGGWTGKGWTQGTQTKGNFVPEQQTDYIFTTVGEEWGFLGSMVVIILFVALLIRILQMAERQKSQFSRVYGYSVASILFIHFFVNIGMVTGLLPTIGIPLPFFSYGGSGLWGFTILLFIFVKLDASNTHYQ